MKKLSIILFVLILAVVQYSCQEEEELVHQPTTPSEGEPPKIIDCGTKPFKPEELEFMQDPDGEFQKLGREFLQNTKIQKYRVPIRAHVLRRSDGSGGITQEDIEASIARVNAHYRPLKMEFYVDKYNYLDNTTDYNTYLSSSDEVREIEFRLANAHTVNEAVNVFFYQNTNTSWAYGVTNADWMVMNNSQTRNESTFSHELGHYFGLPHTHANGDELVNGSNCSSAGDGFCDTPADPGSGFTSTCGYSGTARDANNQAYRPLTDNLMSYASKPCREFFTTQQRQRILYTYIYRTQYKNKTPIVFYDQNAGLGHIWHFSGGQLQENTYAASGWRKSWHSMLTFEENGQSHILLYDKSVGIIMMYNLTVRGKLGTQNYNRWASKDWDIVQAYEHGNQPYILFYDQQTGKAEIHRVSNGRLAGISYSRTWNPGWDIIRTFHQGDTPYAMFYDRQTQRGWMYDMSNGRLGRGTHGGSGWSSDWDIIETFEQGNTPYAVFYDRQTGLARMYNLSGGRLGTRTYEGTWQKTWDVIAPYHEFNQPYLIFYNDGAGHGKIYDVVNGRLNKARTDNNGGWMKNWKMIAAY